MRIRTTAARTGRGTAVAAAVLGLVASGLVGLAGAAPATAATTAAAPAAAAPAAKAKPKPKPGTVWTSAAMSLSTKKTEVSTPVTVTLSLKAGTVKGASGIAYRPVLVEVSTDKQTWVTAASLKTDKYGKAATTLTVPSTEGAWSVRVNVPTFRYWKARVTSYQVVAVIPIQYAPVPPKPLEPVNTGVPVTASLFGSHPVGGTPPAAGSVRLWDTGTTWGSIEPARGVYHWTALDAKVAAAEAAGQDVLYVLGGTPLWAGGSPRYSTEYAGPGSTAVPADPAYFEEFVRAVVNRYGSRIAAYQIWNEANIEGFWNGTADQMADLTARAYSIIKSAQPNAIVVAASTGSRWVWGFAQFYPDYLKALAARNWPIDVYSAHLYPMSDGTPVDRTYLLGMLQTALDNADAPDKPIWETEINYGVTNPGLGQTARVVDGDLAREYVAKTYLDSLRFGIARSYWYAWTAQYHLLGIQMWHATAAAQAYQATVDWLVGSSYLGCEATGQVVDCSFTRDGAPFHVLYTDNSAPAEVGTPAGLTTVTTLTGTTSPAGATLTVTGMPVLVS
ncbi:MAG: hypothetical protein R2737_18260 [Candidatus Nanopelagicales bacterium]